MPDAGPIFALKHVHCAIENEAHALDALAPTLTEGSDLSALRQRVAAFGLHVRTHTRGEELALFPRLDERAPHVGAAYLHDHEDENALFAELDSLFAAAIAGERTHARLRRQLVALSEHVLPHIAKENELVLPLVAKLFTPEEQMGIAGGIAKSVPPEAFVPGVAWMAQTLRPEQRPAWFAAMSRALPPPVLASFTSVVQGTLGPAAWAELQKSV